MLDQLDIRTLSFSTVLYCHIFGIGLLIFHKTQSIKKGINWIGMGLLILGYGFLLMSLRHIVGNAISIVLANSLILSGFIIVSEGLFRFQEYKGRIQWLGPLLFAGFLVLFVYYTYADFNTNRRIVVISICLAIQFSVCVFVLLKKMHDAAQLPYVMAILPIFVSAIFFFFRAAWALGEETLKDFMAAGTVHAVAIIAVQLITITLSFGIVWIANALLQNELKNLARIDPLTGIRNRRGLDDMVHQIIAQMKRDRSPLSLVMVDIDHFKTINDSYGHPTGDTVLSQFASLLERSIRSSDVLSRYGGEEFAILLPNTELATACHVAEKLRAKTQTHAFRSDGGKSLRVTASFGVSSAFSDINWEAMVSRSDDALYRAKNNGRNRVEHIASPQNA